MAPLIEQLAEGAALRPMLEAHIRVAEALAASDESEGAAAPLAGGRRRSRRRPPR